jgi:hypothetical protein
MRALHLWFSSPTETRRKGLKTPFKGLSATQLTPQTTKGMKNKTG